MAAATTSPGRANWSPWKPSRSQSGVHSYVHLPLSWRVCSTPLTTLHPYKLTPSLALSSPPRSSRRSLVRHSVCFFLSLACSFSFRLLIRVVLSQFLIVLYVLISLSLSLTFILSFIAVLFIPYPLLLSCLRWRYSLMPRSHLFGRDPCHLMPRIKLPSLFKRFCRVLTATANGRTNASADRNKGEKSGWIRVCILRALILRMNFSHVEIPCSTSELF